MTARRNISRRDFLKAVASTAVAATSLAACGQAPVPSGSQQAASGTAAASGIAGAAPDVTPATTAPAASSGGPTKLTFVVDTINEGHVKVRDEWVKQFTQQHPEVTIDHQVVPAEYNTKIQTLFAAGTPPDIYRYLQEVTPIVTVAQKNLHLKLDEFIAADKYDTADFRPEALELYRWQGATYALPRDFGHQNVFYNVDLYEKAGVEPPPADWENKTWTFDRFLAAAQKLTKKNGNRTEQWGFLLNRGWRPWASWVYSNGGTVVQKGEGGIATAIALTEPSAVEALQFIQDLMHKHQVAPRPDIEAETGGFELFASGRVGMMITNPSDVNKFRTIKNFRWDVAALPLGKAQRRGTGGGGTGWAISAASKNQKMAWEFLKFIARPESELDEVKVGATTPARTSIITSKEFQDPSKPPSHIAAFAQAQQYVVRDPVHARWPEIFQRVITSNMDQLWTNAKPAADVAAAIKQAADPLLAG
jgi:multiple sugar transport system substrate-binding protein